MYRHDASLGARRVARDRVRKLAARNALEGSDLARLVQVAQQVVEGPVLETITDATCSNL